MTQRPLLVWLTAGALLSLAACGDTATPQEPDTAQPAVAVDGGGDFDDATPPLVEGAVDAQAPVTRDSSVPAPGPEDVEDDAPPIDANDVDAQVPDTTAGDTTTADVVSQPTDAEVNVPPVDTEDAEQDTSTGTTEDTSTGTTEDITDDTLEDTAEDITAGDDVEDIDDTPPLPFLESYGVVETLAGTAFFTAKAFNGWDPEYEGGPALDAELSRPHMTHADAQGRLFVADKDAHAIRRIDTDGTIHTVAGTSEAGDGPDTLTLGTEVALHSPNGLWVRADGTVYILDLVNEKIRRLGTDGMVETFFVAGDLGSGRGLWVSDDEQLAWMSAGTVLKRWTPETGIQIVAEGFVSLGNLAVMPSGQLAVTDRGDNRAWWVGNSGAVMPLAGNGELTGGGHGFSALETGLGGLRGIWFPPDGGILLCAHSASKLFWVDPQGILHLMLDGVSDGTHEGDGELWWTPGAKISEPRAVTMDYQGNILLTEHDGGFIRRIQRTGPLP